MQNNYPCNCQHLANTLGLLGSELQKDFGSN